MSNYNFLQTYQRLQLGLYLDKILNLGFATITYSENDSTSFSNLSLTKDILSPEQLKKIENKLITLNRIPAIYYENIPEHEDLTSFLVSNNYSKHFEDSWMFHDGKNIDTSRFNRIQRVTNEKELQIFIDTFDKCYQKNDPQNPYGDVKAYLNPTKVAWLKYRDKNRFESFIAYKNNEPVAVGSLSNFEGIGYILNIGSTQEVRGEGFGKLITLFCVYISNQNKNNYHCLATERGTFPYNFYQKIGFKDKFSAICYRKS